MALRRRNLRHRAGGPFRFRNKLDQELALRRFAGGLRWVWNRALAEQKARHERG